MELFLLLAQGALLMTAAVMVWRVRQEMQLLLHQAQERYAQLEPLQQQMQHTLREMRSTLSEGIAQLEERLARAEQVLQALRAVEAGTSPPPPTERTVASEQQSTRVPVERILALAESGCDTTEIARQTGVAEGEVALVLQLRASRAQPLHQQQDEDKITLGGGIDA